LRKPVASMTIERIQSCSGLESEAEPMLRILRDLGFVAVWLAIGTVFGGRLDATEPVVLEHSPRLSSSPVRAEALLDRPVILLAQKVARKKRGAT